MQTDNDHDQTGVTIIAKVECDQVKPIKATSH